MLTLFTAAHEASIKQLQAAADRINDAEQKANAEGKIAAIEQRWKDLHELLSSKIEALNQAKEAASALGGDVDRCVFRTPTAVANCANVYLLLDGFFG